MHRKTALRGCHNEAGHLGLDWMLVLMCDYFFWPCMSVQAGEHNDKCHPCITFKVMQPRALLENILATHPLELVHLDYLCLESEKGKEENILVVTDHFTHYAQAYVTWSQTALTTAKALWDNNIVHYGLSEKILLDQGRNFESKLIADLCRIMATQKLWTSPYHSQNNGQYERFNFTLIGMCRILSPEWKSHWKGSTGALVHAYNCTRNSAMGFSLYFYVWEATPPSNWCYLMIGPKFGDHAYLHQIHTKVKGTCHMGP